MENYIKFGSYPLVIIGEYGSGKTTTAAQICNNYKDVPVYYFANHEEDKKIFEDIIKEEHENNYCIKELSVSNIEKIYNMESYGYRKTKAIIVIDNIGSIITISPYKSFKVFYNDEYIEESEAYKKLIIDMLNTGTQHSDLLIIMTSNIFKNIPKYNLITNIMMLSKNFVEIVARSQILTKGAEIIIKEESKIFDNFDKSYVFINISSDAPNCANICSGHRTLINKHPSVDSDILNSVSLAQQETIKDNITGMVKDYIKDTVKNMVKEIVKDYIKNNIKDIIKETIIEELKEF